MKMHVNVPHAAGVLLLAVVASWPAVAREASEPVTVLATLKKGNDRFRADASVPPSIGRGRRSELAGGQQPIATVLSCADSRVPPELIFNVGLGELFVVRSAGEVADRAVVASVEYGLEHLHTPVLIVMGHEACGAVKAASAASEASLGPNLDFLIKAIKPAVARAASRPEAEQLKAAILGNVEEVIGTLLSQSDIVRHLVADGHATVSGAYYELESGRVHFMEPVAAASVRTPR